MIRYLYLLWFLTASFILQARQTVERVAFEEHSYDAGNVSEDDGVVGHDFFFILSGNDSIAISQVEPSCGCIVPEWSSNYLQPGDTGVVKVRFNPKNRPGRFSKHIDVLFSSGIQKQLEIKGEVLNDITIRKKYPYVTGQLRHSLRRVILSNSVSGELKEFSIALYNQSTDTIEIDTLLTYSNKLVRLSFNKLDIEPGEVAQITGLFTTPEQIGYHEYGVQLFTKAATDNLLSFDIVVNVVGNEAEEASRSSILFDKTLVEFGKVNNGTIVQTTIEVFNEGYEVLKIAEIKGNCACISVKESAIEVEPGSSHLLEVYLDTSVLDGFQQKALHLYTNASNGRMHQLMFKIDVRQP